MTKHILGIDVSKVTLDVVLLTPDHSFHKVFDNNRKGFNKLKNWLSHHDAGFTHVCMEVTGQYGLAFAETLYSWGHDISIINPFRIKSYANARLSRNKTDKIDAAIIADFCLSQNPRLWTPPPPVFKELRYLTRHLASRRIGGSLNTSPSNVLTSSISTRGVAPLLLPRQGRN